MKNYVLTASLVLGVSMILSVLVGGMYALKIKDKNRVVRVKGLAEKEVTADLGTFALSITATNDSQEGIVRKINKDIALAQAFLRQAGFGEEEITVENINVRENNYSGTTARFSAEAKITILSANIDLVHETSSKQSALLEEGVLLSGDRWSNGPRYFYTQINEIKGELLGEAIQAARASAEQFAKDSGSKVGKISKADQGVIVLLPASRVSESHEFSRKKIARVVSTISLFLN